MTLCVELKENLFDNTSCDVNKLLSSMNIRRLIAKLEDVFHFSAQNVDQTEKSLINSTKLVQIPFIVNEVHSNDSKISSKNFKKKVLNQVNCAEYSFLINDV